MSRNALSCQLKISVIIPVKNGAATLERCLDILYKQTYKNIEVIILDSISTDNSAAIAKKYGATVVDIATGTFDHGLTRNIGVQHASGELLFFTVQDAWIAEQDMLEQMAEHFNDDEIMAAVGHQAVPHEKDKNPVLWYRPYSKPKAIVRQIQDAAVFKKLPVPEQQSLIAWDNVVALYRKSALIQQPFISTAFAEDWEWSYRALLKGWKLLYDPSLLVYHYHHRNYQYTFNVAYTLNYHFYQYFQYLPSIPSCIMPVIKNSYHLIRNRELSTRGKFYWIRHNAVIICANFFSVINFLTRFKIKGKQGIEAGYGRYCNTIPQGKQK